MRFSLTLLLSLLLTCSFAQNKFLSDSITTILEKVYNDDQVFRKQLDSVQTRFGFNSEELKGLWDRIAANDSINLRIVTMIVDTYGWLGKAQTSVKANTALFLTIQHSTLEVQLRYVDTVRNAAMEGRAKPSEYALLLDRIKMYQGQFQEYGSQLELSPSGVPHFYPIRDEPRVNQRRNTAGLQAIEEYAKVFKLSYKLPETAAYENRFVIKGHVLDKDSHPVENVWISNGCRRLAKTDADGYYLLTVKRKYNLIRIRFHKQGFRDELIQIETKADQDVYTRYMRLYQ